jgi:hypothetical protein
MSFVNGAPWNTQDAVAERTEVVAPWTCWDANQQVGLREMLEEYVWSHSPLLRVSTGAKHLHGDRPEYLSACKRLSRFRPPA